MDAQDRLVAALVANPRAAYAAVTALEDNGEHDRAVELTAAILAAGGTVPDGSSFMPDYPPNQ